MSWHDEYDAEMRRQGAPPAHAISLFLDWAMRDEGFVPTDVDRAFLVSPKWDAVASWLDESALDA